MDERSIVELYAKYDSCKKVAEELGTNAAAVRTVLVRLGIPRTGNRKKPEPKTSKRMPSNCRSRYCAASVVMLRAVLGMTTGEIHEATGIPTGVVVNVFDRKRPDLKLGRCQRMRTAEIDEIEREYLAGASTLEIAARHNTTTGTVSTLMKKRGHERGRWRGPAFEGANKAKREAANAAYELDGENLDHRARQDARRRYRIASRDNDSGITWRKLAEKNGSMACELCGIECDPRDKSWGSFGPTHPSVDHIVRICDGGTDTWDNVRLACMRCNLEQNAIRNRASRTEAVR